MTIIMALRMQFSVALWIISHILIILLFTTVILDATCIHISENHLELQANNTYLNKLFYRYEHNNSNEITTEGVDRFMHDVNLFHAHKKNNTVKILEEDIMTFGFLRQHDEENIHTSKWHQNSIISSSTKQTVENDTNKCLDSNEILLVFDEDQSNKLDKDEFGQLFAYVVHHQIWGIDCEDDDDSGSDAFNPIKVYGYGTLVVAIISACSAFGFLIIPRLPSSVYDIAMTSFMALAFGTLTGDALLHLIPEALSINDNNNKHNIKVRAPNSFWKCLAIMFSIYFLFAFEGLMQLLFGEHEDGGPVQGKGRTLDQEHGHSHHHSHEFVKEQTTKRKRTRTISQGSNYGIQRTLEQQRQSIVSFQIERVTVCLGLSTLALVIIIGDAIHNVTDGIAIGAAFAHDMESGLATSIAVWFHELPHEFGDFVILLSTGMSLNRALMWNFLSSLTSFVGLYIGIVVGENKNADHWIFAVTTGMFLYVAIGNMLPEMRIIKTDNKPMAFVGQNIGVLFGMGFMIFMYFLEDMVHT